MQNIFHFIDKTDIYWYIYDKIKTIKYRYYEN